MDTHASIEKLVLLITNDDRYSDDFKNTLNDLLKSSEYDKIKLILKNTAKRGYVNQTI